MRWYLLLSLILLSTWLSPLAHAETMQSTSYTVRQGNFNVTSGVKSSSSYSLSDTVGQTATEYFSSSGYHVKAGFQYLYTLYDFSFSLSALSLNLGTTSPNSFSTNNHTLTVNAPGQGYSVTAIAAHRLKNLADPTDFIASTTCDSGTCTTSSASVWTTASNNGFGFNVTGSDKAADFTDSTYYRPFADASLGDSPATIITSSAAGKNRTSTINYKLSVPGTQAGGTYATQITYIATPVY